MFAFSEQDSTVILESSEYGINYEFIKIIAHCKNITKLTCEVDEFEEFSRNMDVFPLDENSQ
jgi:hypothetical protein